MARAPRRGRPSLACGLALLLGSLAPDAGQAQSSAGDAAAKARFVVTLARFVQWPPGTFANDAGPLRLCVLHASAAVGQAFAGYSGEMVAGHQIAIAANPASTAGCELLFVDSSAPRTAPPAQPASAAMLTLGAVDGFAAHGGMVEIANVNDQLRFDVNLKAVRQSQLQLSSQVLRLARQVLE